MKVGSFVYATDQGLGILAKSFYDNGIVTHPCILPHHSRENKFAWYPEGTPICFRPSGYNIAHDWVKNLDVFLIFETPFDWTLINTARQHGVKVVLMPMYECTPHVIPAMPDKWICPSLLDYQYFPNTATRDSVYLPVPVDVPWKLREKARVFVHNSGHGGLKGRNGTAELIQAVQFIKSPLHLIIRSQEQLPEVPNVPSWVNLDIQIGNVPRESLFSSGDVFVFPEKFNGLSLPLQEAYASGMLVMATERYPNTEYLPTQPLIPISGTRRNCVSGHCLVFDEALIEPRTIAATMDKWFDVNIENYSLDGKLYADNNSWEVLKPAYLEALS